MKKTSRHNFHFTMVEIMVALAVLLLMMVFLLSFANGARRIFTETNRQNTLFNDAQAVMATMKNDLTNMVCSYEFNKTTPFYHEAKNDSVLLGFYSTQPSHLLPPNDETTDQDGKPQTQRAKKAGLYPIIYYFDGDHTLYRFLWDSGTIENSTPWDLLTDTTDDFSTFFKSMKKHATEGDHKIDYEVLDNVASFTISPMKEDADLPPDDLVAPTAITISLDLYARNSISEMRWAQLSASSKETEINRTRRRFTKFFLLPPHADDVIFDSLHE